MPNRRAGLAYNLEQTSSNHILERKLKTDEHLSFTKHKVLSTSRKNDRPKRNKSLV